MTLLCPPVAWSCWSVIVIATSLCVQTEYWNKIMFPASRQEQWIVLTSCVKTVSMSAHTHRRTWGFPCCCCGNPPSDASQLYTFTSLCLPFFFFFRALWSHPGVRPPETKLLLVKYIPFFLLLYPNPSIENPRNAWILFFYMLLFSSCIYVE